MGIALGNPRHLKNLPLAFALLVIAASAVEAAPYDVIALRRNALPDLRGADPKTQLVSDPLYTELGRQALLLAAREECGVATRDDSLYEDVDHDAGDTFDASLRLVLKRGSDMTIARGGNVLWEGHLSKVQNPVLAYHAICDAIEPLTRGAFADVLEAQGFERKPHEWLESAPLSDEQESLLQKMNDIAQWRALRSIHTDIKQQGESPERLGGLVRGYANLAQLTLPLLDLRHQVFRARALLYAKRLSYRALDVRFADWHQKYAYVLCGLIRSAHDSFQAQDAARDSEDAPPVWLPILRGYCAYRIDELSAAGFDQPDSPSAELAQLLWFRAVQQCGSNSQTLEAGQRVLKANPCCLWIVDAMYESAGVGYNHVVTRMGPALHSRQLAQWLPEATDLPDGIAEKLTGEGGAPNIFTAAEVALDLITAGEEDRAEPSLASLGRTVEGWNVLHTMRLGLFIKWSLGSSAERELKALEPVLAVHPLAPLVRTLGLSRNATLADYSQILREFQFIDGNRRTVYGVLNRIPAGAHLAEMDVEEAKGRLYPALSDCEADLQWLLRENRSPNPAYLSHSIWKVTQVSETSPIRVAMLIKKDFQKMKPKFEDWDTIYGACASYNLAVANGYQAEQDSDQAILYYERYLKIAHDRDVFGSLADIYFQQGDDEKWLATLERVFEHPDYGLDHSFTESTIAATLMSRGLYEEALPWAERAAGSGSAQSMQLHCECLTALGQFEKAEEIVKYLTERYPQVGATYWYQWCAETGQGKIGDAWADNRKRLRQRGAIDAEALEQAVVFHQIVTDDHASARRMLEKRLASKFNQLDAINLALLCDADGDAQGRDKWLQAIAEAPQLRGPGSLYGRIAALLQQAILEPPLTQQRIDAFREEMKQQRLDGYRNTSDRMIGVFLANQGQDELAIECLKYPTRTWGSTVDRIIAWRRLRDLGVEPTQIKERRFPSQYVRAQPAEPRTK